MCKRHIIIETERNRNKWYKSSKQYGRKTNKKCRRKVHIQYIHNRILHKWLDCSGLCVVRGNKHVDLKLFSPQCESVPEVSLRFCVVRSSAARVPLGAGGVCPGRAGLEQD